MKLSVIIPSYNRADTLRVCLQKLLLQQGVDFEVIVVDDGSSDHTQKVMRDFKTVKYVWQKNAHQAAARNRGAKEATGDIILFIGDDIFVEPGFLMQHMDVHAKYPTSDVVCLGYTTWDPAVNISAYMRFLESSGWQFAYNQLNRGFITHPEPYKFFYTSNISMKRSVFQKEQFNEAFKKYGWEDIELGYRLWKHYGMRIFYKPDAMAYHHHEMPESSLEKRMTTVGRTAVLFEKLEPSVSVMPKGLKWLILMVLTTQPFLGLSILLGRNFHYKLRSWKAFFNGVKEGRELDKSD